MKRTFMDEHGVRWEVEDVEVTADGRPHDPEITPARIQFSSADGRRASTKAPEGALRRAGDDALRLWLLEALAGK